MLKLRPYQQSAIAAIYSYFEDKNGNPLVVIPTAGGKSLVMASFIDGVLKAWPDQRILVVTHDLSGAIDSYTFSKTGTQLQISDGIYTTTLSVGGSFTLRTASGSTSVAIDFTQGGAIKLGGTQVVGSATFDPIAAILDPENYSDNAEFRQITVNSDGSYNGHEGIVDVFVIDASQALSATIVGFEEGDILEFRNHSEELGVSFQNTVFNDETAILLAGSATITLTSLANDNFGDEATFEDTYGASAIGYVM